MRLKSLNQNVFVPSFLTLLWIISLFPAFPPVWAADSKEIKILVQQDNVYVYDHNNYFRGISSGGSVSFWIKPDDGITLYFLKVDKRFEEKELKFRLGYKNNSRTIPPGYFKNHDKYPENGIPIILEEWSVKERLLGFIRKNPVQVSIAIFLVSFLSIFGCYRLYKHLDRHWKMEKAQKIKDSITPDDPEELKRLKLDNLVGSKFGSNSKYYEMLKLMAHGGMGAVFMALDLERSETVAIKTILPDRLANDEKFKKRFLRETEIVSRLKHPGIILIYDFGEDEGSKSLYIVMEYLEGEPLSAKIASGESQNLRKTLKWSVEILQALDYAHNRGVIHRDMKPGNIFICSNDRVKLLDFGLAKKDDSSPITATSSAFLGTACYAPPEQLGDFKNVDSRADLYSFGVILYEMLTGGLPFPDKSLWILTEPSVPLPRDKNPNIPESLEKIVMKLIEKNADDRYQTAADIINAIKEPARELGTRL